MNRRAFLSAGLAVGLFVMAAGPVAAPVAAQADLAAAKAAGHIGERPDGLVGATPGAPESAEALAAQINAQRLARYEQIARSNGASVDAVRAVAGRELVERTPPGQFVFVNGAWVRK